MGAGITTAAATKAAGTITEDVPTAADIITADVTITVAGMNTIRAMIMAIIEQRP